ncbi:dynein beta chain, flagellar outer arm, putative [Eimeria necatrix]|uniref:Dynein beta chain, flagellar outer arm, putative n=1 Tax=Eimeria necatrix TaxID=51315 RepID=U6N2F0_9EIME|nr:dynein beta chain, flagellar outer arm, putative [Eimeria necatrix]CDJ70402.1 dynein beta chain, flagellar outer arm, putative [Eimeria necatrix]
MNPDELPRHSPSNNTPVESVSGGAGEDGPLEGGLDACCSRPLASNRRYLPDPHERDNDNSLVAEALRCTAPYRLVQNADWSLPHLREAKHNIDGVRVQRSPPIMHSLLNDCQQVQGESIRKKIRNDREKSLSTLQQMVNTGSAVPKHISFLYDAFVNTTASPNNGGAEEVRYTANEQLERLMAMQTEGENPAAQNQDLDEQGYADLTKVKTERDAVAFFARHGSTTKTKFLFCNRAPTDPMVFDPYKLVVVPQNEVNPEHFTISETAVMHICPGKPSECFRQDEWMRQAFVHSLLRTLPFFKTFVARKVLCLWSHASRKHVFDERRETLCKTLFVAKPIYCEHLLQIHKVLAGVSEVKLVELQPTLYDISQFIAQQQALSSDPKTGATKELEAKHSEARSLLAALMQKLHEATQLPEVDPMQACSTNKGKSIFQAKREAAEQQRRIRLAYKNQALFGQFILLVDLILTMRLAKAVTNAAAKMLERLGTAENCSKLFSVNVSFGSKKVELDPSRLDFISMHQEWWDGVISTVSSVPLLSQCRQFEDSVAQGPTLSLESLLSKSKHLQVMKKRIEERLFKDFDRAQKYSESYFGIYRQIYEYGRNWDETEFANSITGHDELSSEMELITEFEEKLEKLNPVHAVGLFSIEARTLKSSLQPITERALTFMKRLLWKLMKEHVRATASRFESINRRLDERPTKLLSFASFVSSCKEIKSQIEDLDRDKADAEEMFALLKQYGVRLAVEDTIQLENMLKSANEFETFKLLDAAEHIRNNIQAMKLELKAKTQEVDNEIQDLDRLVNDDEYTRLDALKNATRCFEQLKEYQQRIDFAYGKAETLRGMKELLAPESPAVISKQTQETFRRIKPKVEMWQQICSWQADTSKWLGLPLSSLNSEEIEARVKRYLKEACIALQNFPTDSVAVEFKKEVESWIARLPLIMDLGNPALKRRHWEAILGELE